MATLGQVVATLGDHENKLNSHEATLAAMELRLQAVESGALLKLMEMIRKMEVEKKDGLNKKEGKDNLPDDFHGDRRKFRGFSHQVYVWAISIYPDGGQ